MIEAMMSSLHCGDQLEIEINKHFLRQAPQNWCVCKEVDDLCFPAADIGIYLQLLINDLKRL